MLGPKTYAALRRMAEKALDKTEGDPDEAFALVHRRLRTGTTRDRDLREAIVDNAVISVLSDITMEAQGKVKSGLMNMCLPV